MLSTQNAIGSYLYRSKFMVVTSQSFINQAYLEGLEMQMDYIRVDQIDSKTLQARRVGGFEGFERTP